ncbi:hypothetical protein PR202_gb04387 [Eleusine coracana subsp. coracana]|uniref:WRKY domain-containing protein n=1 Tax=Eleusine coracana subsp. coracana TaxID=191504 RepID=A0AAV5E4G6_ELECO|nr:hypothetical protein PR202_gb04387 [Eleusine coracana subsp. coracana]
MALMTPDAVVLELMTMGQESALYLADLLGASSPASPHQELELAAEILRCCGRVIAALTTNSTGGGNKKRKAVEHGSPAAAPSPPSPSTPPRKRTREAALGVVKRRTMEDGFIWRKYGQKEINGRKHPRLYYRCAYSHQGCTATRRVQRTHEDAHQPAAYEIAYYGEHNCRGAAACQQNAPPTVIDFGSNAWGCGTAPAAVSEQLLFSCDGETMSSQGGWSPATASEVGFEAETAHEWHDGAAQVEVPGMTPSDPATEFSDGGCFDWESLINDVPSISTPCFHRIATLH